MEIYWDWEKITRLRVSQLKEDTYERTYEKKSKEKNKEKKIKSSQMNMSVSAIEKLSSDF